MRLEIPDVLFRACVRYSKTIFFRVWGSPCARKDIDSSHCERVQGFRGTSTIRLDSYGMVIKLLIKVGTRVSHHARRWYVPVASAFPLA
jgi:hypothetical protein